MQERTGIGQEIVNTAHRLLEHIEELESAPSAPNETPSDVLSLIGSLQTQQSEAILKDVHRWGDARRKNYEDFEKLLLNQIETTQNDTQDIIDEFSPKLEVDISNFDSKLSNARETISNLADSLIRQRCGDYNNMSDYNNSLSDFNFSYDSQNHQENNKSNIPTMLQLNKEISDDAKGLEFQFDPDKEMELQQLRLREAHLVKIVSELSNEIEAMSKSNVEHRLEILNLNHENFENKNQIESLKKVNLEKAKLIEQLQEKVHFLEKKNKLVNSGKIEFNIPLKNEEISIKKEEIIKDEKKEEKVENNTILIRNVDFFFVDIEPEPGFSYHNNFKNNFDGNNFDEQPYFNNNNQPNNSNPKFDKFDGTTNQKSGSFGVQMPKKWGKEEVESISNNSVKDRNNYSIHSSIEQNKSDDKLPNILENSSQHNAEQNNDQNNDIQSNKQNETSEDFNTHLNENVNKDNGNIHDNSNNNDIIPEKSTPSLTNHNPSINTSVIANHTSNQKSKENELNPTNHITEQNQNNNNIQNNENNGFSHFGEQDEKEFNALLQLEREDSPEIANTNRGSVLPLGIKKNNGRDSYRLFFRGKDGGAVIVDADVARKDKENGVMLIRASGVKASSNNENIHLNHSNIKDFNSDGMSNKTATQRILEIHEKQMLKIKAIRAAIANSGALRVSETKIVNLTCGNQVEEEANRTRQGACWASMPTRPPPPRLQRMQVNQRNSHNNQNNHLQNNKIIPAHYNNQMKNQNIQQVNPHVNPRAKYTVLCPLQTKIVVPGKNDFPGKSPRRFGGF
ncbi:hypothetical protein TRFO_34403 [Tritrichomonas foetus]|uniref:Uncharacterized protein n=1 Tax=Tritrichomonas foetus TaxID=1144522 RepID=A0A1J4JJ67_9EUKA|nr:hypothetical protein TRFO_34403 [Tritrichomonas foetus]|eukprot:OHS99194.1 hypothetical protein TRFO_34403 [Tritrichomonas foetus]